jgi:hypothetical protein
MSLPPVSLPPATLPPVSPAPPVLAPPRRELDPPLPPPELSPASPLAPSSPPSPAASSLLHATIARDANATKTPTIGALHGSPTVTIAIRTHNHQNMRGRGSRSCEESNHDDFGPKRSGVDHFGHAVGDCTHLEIAPPTPSNLAKERGRNRTLLSGELRSNEPRTNMPSSSGK